MKNLFVTWGKHLLALILFLIVTVIYFSPAVLEHKTLQQGDMEKAAGMGNSQMEKFAQTAKPGDFSTWSDAMFGGMPYSSGYGDPAPKVPSYTVVESLTQSIGYMDAGMMFTGLVCFYILMCVLGVNWWLALAGAFAFAFSSYNIIIIVAGHITKAYVIAFMPLAIAGMALLFKKKYIWGTVLFILGVALSISNSHIQITYYLVLLSLFIYLGFLFIKIKNKEFGELIKVSAIMLGCVILAVLPNARSLYQNWDLGKNSTRGATELTTTTPKGEKISSGLDKDYAFQWSYGWKELMTEIVPNVYGGASGGTLSPESNLYKQMQMNGAQVSGDGVQSYTYWGDKPFTSGPVYFGAVVCFLFILGMFVIKNPMKWWLFAGAAFLTFLALGRNFGLFNDFMFHNLPLYNKFRTVEMALVIPQLIYPLIGMWGLYEVFSGKVNDLKMKKSFLWSLGISGGLCLIIWIMPSMLFSFQSTYDDQFRSQVPEWYYNSLILDRKALATSDALRSLLLILATAALLLWYWKSKNKTTMATVVGVGVTILILGDLWSVDRRYLNDKNYSFQTNTDVYKPTVADNAILQDKTLSYRVLNLNNPWQETATSYYHHSVGGYYAAKLRRYQELIDHRLDGELKTIITALQSAKSMEDINAALSSLKSLNMLNTKYIIYNPGQPPLVNPYADGNAWFVSEAKVVDNADAEMAALNTIDPLKTAVVDKRFAASLKGFTPKADSTATIKLDAYRPNRLTYSYNSSVDQLVVFSEIYYQPGWKATIDGKSADHFRADWILRGMVVPSGKHQIVFEFYPDGYVTAAKISAYSSLLILLILIGAIGYSIWGVYRKSEKKA